MKRGLGADSNFGNEPVWTGIVPAVRTATLVSFTMWLFWSEDYLRIGAFAGITEFLTIRVCYRSVRRHLPSAIANDISLLAVGPAVWVHASLN